MSFTLPRLPSVHQTSNHNIRNSEDFPRIREAENKVAKKKKPPPKSSLYTEKEDANIPQPLFTSFILNEDPKVARHMPFNEVVYPNIHNGGEVEDPSATLDTYWVSGYIDRGIRDGKSYDAKRVANRKRVIKETRKAKKIAVAKEKALLSPNSNPNMAHGSPHKGSTDSPLNNGSSVMTLSPSKDSIVSNITTDELKSSSAGGSTLSTKKSKRKQNKITKDSVLSKEDIASLSAAVKKEHPNKRAVDNAVFDSAPSFEIDQSAVKTKPSTFTVNDNFRLEKLEERADRVTGALPRMAFKPIYKQKVDNYLKNDVLAEPPVSSFEIENLFDRERIENEAATKLQKAYVHSCVVAKIRNVVKGMLAAVKIQKMFRGIITRKWTSLWVRRRTDLITQWQSRVRKWYVNKHNRPVIEHERLCAIKIQKIVLGRLGRCRWTRIRQDKAAERIQVLWRGVLARSRSDRIWLNKSVIPIQCKARALVSKMRYKSILEELSDAALVIQRCFRSWFSLKKLANRLRRREDAYREFTGAKLATEEEWCEDMLIKLGARLKKRELDKKIRTVVADYILSADAIHKLSNDLIETTRQKGILSARAIEQGWLADLTGQVQEMRADLTKSKLKFCFEKVPLLRSLEVCFMLYYSTFCILYSVFYILLMLQCAVFRYTSLIQIGLIFVIYFAFSLYSVTQQEMLEEKVDEIDEMRVYRDSIADARDEVYM